MAGFSQRFSNVSICFFKPADVEAVISAANEAMSKVFTPDELRRELQPLLIEAAGTDDVEVRLANVHPMIDVSAISTYFEKNERHQREPLIHSLAPRLKGRPHIDEAAAEMKALGYAMVMGVFSNGQYFGLVLVGERVKSGAFADGQLVMMKTLVKEFGDALENAQLYSEIQSSKVYNEILLDNLISGVIAINKKWEITVMNREARRILGYPESTEVTGKMGELPMVVKEGLTGALEEGMDFHDKEVKIERASGDPLDISMGAASFSNGEGKEIGALVVLHDVSVEKKLESHAQENDTFAHVGRATKDYVHEIRNPLSTFQTFIQLIPERSDDAEFMKEFAAIADAELDRVSRLLRSLLGYAKKDSLAAQMVRVHDLIDIVTGFMDPQTKNSGVAVKTQLNAEMDGIYCKPDELKQILMNIFMNGIQAMLDGGNLTISTEAGTLPGRRDGILIKISDDGIGIPSSKLDKIGSGSYTTKKHGSGIGVRMSMNLARKMGGRLTYESTEGLGTTAMVLLPLRNTNEKAG